MSAFATSSRQVVGSDGKGKDRLGRDRVACVGAGRDGVAWYGVGWDAGGLGCSSEGKSGKE